MRFFKKVKLIERPSRLMRKADVGDTIVFLADHEGLSQYYPHVGHEAEVLAVQLQPLSHRRSGRAVFEVLCECGTTLHPRSTEFELV